MLQHRQSQGEYGRRSREHDLRAHWSPAPARRAGHGGHARGQLPGHPPPGTGRQQGAEDARLGGCDPAPVRHRQDHRVGPPQPVVARVMKALVLAGGSGSRLRPITHTSAKQLLPVANKPVLFYGLEAIADAGIADVGIVVGDTAPAIRAAVGDGSQFGLNVTYIRQRAPLGLAHAVLIAGDFLGDDDFVMYLGDNFIIGGIAGLVDEFMSARPDAQILLTTVPDPRQFGVAELDDAGEVIGLDEKPVHPKSDLALVGVYIFTAAVHEAVRQLTPSGRGELEITEAVQWLIDDGRKVRSTLISGYWKDTGNVADMLEVNRMVLEGITARQQGVVDEETELI